MQEPLQDPTKYCNFCGRTGPEDDAHNCPATDYQIRRTLAKYRILEEEGGNSHRRTKRTFTKEEVIHMMKMIDAGK